MTRRITEASLRSISDVHAAILDGGWDGELESLGYALAFRKKTMFRPGTKVRLVGTSNVQIDGKIGVVLKVNPKRISVGLGEKQSWGGYEAEYNVPLRMLEVVS